MGASTGSTGVGEMVGLQAPAQPAGGHGQRGGHTRAGDGGGGGDGVGDAREIFLCLNFLRSMVAPTLEGDQRRGEGAVLGVCRQDRGRQPPEEGDGRAGAAPIPGDQGLVPGNAE